MDKSKIYDTKDSVQQSYISFKYLQIYKTSVDYITDVKTKVEYAVLEDIPKILHLSKVCHALFF